MIKLSLNTWERLTLLGLINSQTNVPVGDLRKLMRMVPVLELNDEEKEEVGMKTDGQVSSWNNKDVSWPIDLETEDFELLKRIVNSNKWRAIDGPLALALVDKFEST